MGTLARKHPEQLKLPFYLWTREAVALLIKRRFGLQLSVWTVGRYLKRWSFIRKNQHGGLGNKIRSRSGNDWRRNTQVRRYLFPRETRPICGVKN
jgi:hypothetical protein